MTEEKVAEKADVAVVKSPESEHAHHHHSWLGKHFCVRNFKRLGALGVVVFVLHILFHVVEILIIPAILVWLGM